MMMVKRWVHPGPSWSLAKFFPKLIKSSHAIFYRLHVPCPACDGTDDDADAVDDDWFTNAELHDDGDGRAQCSLYDRRCHMICCSIKVSFLIYQHQNTLSFVALDGNWLPELIILWERVQINWKKWSLIREFQSRQHATESGENWEETPQKKFTPTFYSLQ